MSLEDYTSDELISEFFRRQDNENVMVQTKHERFTNPQQRYQVLLNRLNEFIFYDLERMRCCVEKDRERKTHTFNMGIDIKIHVTYRNIVESDGIITDLEDISCEFNGPNTHVVEAFKVFFFNNESLENFFWSHLHDDLPPSFTNEDELENLVMRVQDNLDIPEIEAYDIVYKFTGVE